MTERVRVADADELGPGDRTIFPVEGVMVSVLNVDGEYYAIRNECPHQHGPVGTGNVFRELVAEYVGPGEHVEVAYSDVPTIACPFHGWEFDLRTGEHLGDGAYGVDTYDVTVEDGGVYVEVTPGGE